MEWLESNKDAVGVFVNLHPKDIVIVEEAMGKSVGSGVGTASRAWVKREVLICTGLQIVGKKACFINFGISCAYQLLTRKLFCLGTVPRKRTSKPGGGQRHTPSTDLNCDLK